MPPPTGRRSPTRASLGTASLSTSSLFVISSGDKPESPVTLPPGRARLAIRPAATGSPTFVITMGMAVVAFFAANADVPSVTTIRSTLRRTNSAASSVRREGPLLSANWYSMLIFFPSIHPSLLISCRNASTRTALPEAGLASRKPIRVTFVGCCASTAEHGARSREHRERRMIFLVIAARPAFPISDV